MQKAWRAFRDFWTAEEIPRWFGFSLVLIYLACVGSVAHFGIAEARREGYRNAQLAVRHSVSLLAAQFHAATRGGADLRDPPRAGIAQRLLQDFAGHVPCQVVRVVDNDGLIHASTLSAEVGTRISQTLAGTLNNGFTQPGGSSNHGVIRAAVRPSRASLLLSPPVHGEVVDTIETTTESTAPALYIEAVAVIKSGGNWTLADGANVLTIVLLGLAAMFVLYRRFREQLRPVSRIADRLQTRREDLEADLSALRITDIRDVTTNAWNNFVDMAQQLSDAARRSQADDELSRVLKRGGSNAIADALNALPDGIILITDEARFEYVNASACRLLGWPQSDPERPPLNQAEAKGVGGQLLDAVRGALGTEGAFEARNLVLDSEAESGCYRAWIIPLQRNRHQGECLVVVRDVSQQIKAERARDEFVTQIAHELRTPLTNIRAYSETLSSGMFDDPKVITECYNVIGKETRRLSRLIEDVLSVSQFEVGSFQLRTDVVDLKALLSEAVRDVRGLADDKRIDIQTVLPAKMEPVRADRDKLAIVVNNLLGNAIKYTKPGGNVVVGCQFNTDSFTITFKDNGIGIDPADHRKIFEKFQRGSDPEALNETGTGIGLYTAREIIRGHGGDIELISQKGQGSTFLVRLPHTAGRASALTTPKES